MFTLACAEQGVAANGYDNGWNWAGAGGSRDLKSGAACRKYAGVKTLLVSKGSSSFTAWRKLDVLKDRSKGSPSHMFGTGSARVKTLGLNFWSFKGNLSSDLVFSFSRTEDKLTTGFTGSSNSCGNRFGWAFRSCDPGNAGEDNVSASAVLDLGSAELEANGFDRLTELLWERGWEDEGNRVCFAGETLRGSARTVLGGGPCRKCPLHAGLKLSKLRTGFNWKWCMTTFTSPLRKKSTGTSYELSKLY